ncbi:hypothetical protein ACTWPT_12355 [Nonomuraea sp. 3N208]|uniref:hypothetical protein n=1 Tax=Nonomuraea sp. 3N208 TaxID=3457421 RepID=UPI003FCD0743
MAAVSAVAVIFFATAGCDSSDDPDSGSSDTSHYQPKNPDMPDPSGEQGEDASPKRARDIDGETDQHDTCDINDPASPCGGAADPPGETE